MGGSFFSETSWGFLIFQWKVFVCFLCHPLNSLMGYSPLHLSVLVQDLDKCPQVSAFRDAEGLTDYLCYQFLLCQSQEGYLWPLQSSSRCLWWSIVLTCFSKFTSCTTSEALFAPNPHHLLWVFTLTPALRALLLLSYHLEGCWSCPVPLQVPPLPSMRAEGQTATRCFFNTTLFKNSTQWRYAEFTGP